MVVGGQSYALTALLPGKEPGTPCTGGWFVPRGFLEGCGKYRSSTGFDLQTIQPVASGYTDYSIPAHSANDNCVFIKY